MSIFSSWLAAPNSGVITYIGTSTSGTIAASPWPMPEVSTMIRSKPASLARGEHVGQRLADLAAGVARREAAHEDARAVAATAPIAFMRMRSPSSAPPLLRRVGSIEMTAMLQRVALVEAEAADQLVGQATTCRRRRCR